MRALRTLRVNLRLRVRGGVGAGWIAPVVRAWRTPDLTSCGRGVHSSYGGPTTADGRNTLSTTSTATVLTAEGYRWTVTAELAAIDDADRDRIDAGLRAFVDAMQEGRRYSVDVHVPDHPAVTA